MLRSNLKHWLPELPADPSQLSFSEYMGLTWDSEGGKIPVVCWGNYLALFLARQAEHVSECLLATQGLGDRPHPDHYSGLTFEHVENHLLAGCVDYWLEHGKWIVNIDLDYFFYYNKEDPLL